MRLHCLLTSLALVLPGVCLADLKDENLLQNLPTGYKVDFQNRQGNMIITEMVPQAESVKDWSEMVTTQVFLGMKSATPEQFRAVVGKGWVEACKGGEVIPIAQGEENHYAFSVWLQGCPLNPATGKPEITWFKAIRGNDSFYVVQKAFRFSPSKEQVTHWMQYLQSVKVCDSRLPDRVCPVFQQTTQQK